MLRPPARLGALPLGVDVCRKLTVGGATPEQGSDELRILDLVAQCSDGFRAQILSEKSRPDLEADGGPSDSNSDCTMEPALIQEW